MAKISNRNDLKKALRTILGSNEVYFQPPESKKLTYPCIIYELGDYNLIHADNGKHHIDDLYNITLITKLPDETIGKALLELPMCGFNRVFINDGLYHYVFTIYI